MLSTLLISEAHINVGYEQFSMERPVVLLSLPHVQSREANMLQMWANCISMFPNRHAVEGYLK